MFATMEAGFRRAPAGIHRFFQHVEHAAQRATVPSRLPKPGAADPFVGLLPWDLATRAALKVPSKRGSGVDTAYGRQLIDFAGMCTYDRAISLGLASSLALSADDLTSDMRRRILERGRDPDSAEHSFRFHEACHRGPGRLDMRNYRLLEPPFDDGELGDNASWIPLVESVLGGHASLLWKGLVVTEPGALQQAYYADGPPVSHAEWQRHGLEPRPEAMLPCHCLTVMVPLVDLDAENGPTIFLPGTHHVATSAAISDEAIDRGWPDGAGAPVPLHASAGDAILFDYRLFHAGGANRSCVRRPILYYVYARPWFEDLHNFPGPENSLFAAPALAELASVWEDTEVW